MPTSKGRLYVVGIGPGAKEQLTDRALKALRSADVIVGYRSYIRKVQKILPDKTYREYKMGKEIDRVKDAISLAQSGKSTVIISSGDPGIYGMAGPVLENAPNDLLVEILPGLSSLSFCSALLGAPLMNDFVVISLSDLLTPQSTIMHRLRSALDGGFVIVIYNPTSKQRAPLFAKALRSIKKERPENTWCGVVRQDRLGAFHASAIELCALEGQKIDMNTTVFIGNEHTVLVNGRLVTKRGYDKKK